MSAAHLPLVLMLAVWSWGAYAAMALHFMVVAIAAFWSALIRPAVRLRGMMFGAAMILMAVTRLLKPIGPYGKKILGLGVFQFTFYSAVLGWPLLSALMTLIAGAALLWSLRSLRSAATAARIATTAIVLGGVCLVPWAIRPGNWIDAQGYRFWYPAIAVVLMFGAMAEATWSSSADETSIQHRRAGSLVALGAVFLVVMSLQSLTWMDMTRRLSNLIANANNACVSRTQIEWLKDTPLQHWSTDYYVVELQSQKPAVVMLEDNDCATLAATGKLRVGLSSQFRGPQDGWFDFSRVRPINPRP